MQAAASGKHAKATTRSWNWPASGLRRFKNAAVTGAAPLCWRGISKKSMAARCKPSNVIAAPLNLATGRLPLFYGSRSGWRTKIALQKLARSCASLKIKCRFRADHAKLATTVALQIDEFKRALTLAQKAVPATSRDYRDKLWLAHIQWLVGQPLEAQATLREAVRIAPRVPEVWVALVRHLNRTKLSKHLEDTLREMEQKIPADRADLTKALCLEAAGKTEEAEAKIATMIQGIMVQAPSPGNDDGVDLVTVGQIAEFYLRQDQFAKAEPLLRHLLAPSTMAPPELTQWARRHLAIALANQGQTKGVQEAVNLVEKSSPLPGPAVVEDERVRAFVLAKQWGKQAEAVRLFEESLIKKPLTAYEQFLLAQVYDANQEDTKASRQMRSLLVIHRDQPRYLAYYIRYLLNRGEAEAALFYLTALELVEPNSSRTLQLRSDYQKSRAGG